jgi:hypothetical protein
MSFRIVICAKLRNSFLKKGRAEKLISYVKLEVKYFKEEKIPLWP